MIGFVVVVEQIPVRLLDKCSLGQQGDFEQADLPYIGTVLPFGVLK